MRPEATAVDDLGYRDRREVARAVREGRAVADPALASAAVLEAQRVQELAHAWSLTRPASWPSLLGGTWSTARWLFTGAFLFFLLVRPDPVAVALACAVGVLFVVAVVRYARNASARAADAEAANLGLLAGQEHVAPREARPKHWWTPRAFAGRPNAARWVPISLRYLVPVWAAWAAAAIVCGLFVPPAVGDWLPLVYFLAWVEIERRLAEPVVARLGGDVEKARACDVLGRGRGPAYIARFLLLQVAVVGLVWGLLQSGWFHGHEVGATFGLILLFMFVCRDAASRWRWRRLQAHVH
jgi:hypothetical protein